jgi:hypothetical protein
VANSTNQSFTYGIGCIRCGQTLIAPEWSEYVSELCVHHAWICDDCGVRFETSDHLHFPEPRRSLQFPLVMNNLGVSATCVTACRDTWSVTPTSAE